MAATVTSVRLLGVCAAMLVFASPDIARATSGHAVSYAAVTVLLAVVVAGAALLDVPHHPEIKSRTTPRSSPAPSRHVSRTIPRSIAVGAVAATLIVLAAYRWTTLAAWLPYEADMLIVIREATRRFLSGHNPYAIYRAYDAPWDMAMPYGPMLWAPFLVAQLLRLDFRILTIAGQLTVPIWCAIAATADAARHRVARALAWLTLTATLLFILDVQRFTLIGHTPIYWPLFPLLALTMARRRWIAAAIVLGLLVAARTTMAAIAPIFLIAAFVRERHDFWTIASAFAIALAATLLPFALWGPRMLWDSMVLSYPRVMHAAVWPVLARPGLETVGVTEWLIEHGRGSLVASIQIAVMLVLYLFAWIAIRRGGPPLRWMTLALFAFSMTTLYPVHYLYYDVFLLFACDALAVTIDASIAPHLLRPWLLSTAAAAALALAMMAVVASPSPHVDLDHLARADQLRAGFGAIEHDGARPFAWIVGNDARIILPRSVATPADIVITAESPLDAHAGPQRMVAILNGTSLGETSIAAGAHAIRLAPTQPAWWVGYNELRLLFSSTAVPHDLGGSEDRRPLALAIGAIDVVEKKSR